MWCRNSRPKQFYSWIYILCSLPFFKGMNITISMDLYFRWLTISQKPIAIRNVLTIIVWIADNSGIIKKQVFFPLNVRCVWSLFTPFSLCLSVYVYVVQCSWHGMLTISVICQGVRIYFYDSVKMLRNFNTPTTLIEFEIWNSGKYSQKTNAVKCTQNQ